MKEQISTERRIASIIISVISNIIFMGIMFGIGIIMSLTVKLPSTVTAALSFLIGGFIAFLMMFIYNNGIKKSGYEAKEIMKTAYSNVMFALIFGFIIKLGLVLFFIVKGLDQTLRDILCTGVDIVFMLIFVYSANIQLTRSPEVKAELQRQIEEAKRQQQEKKNK